MANQMKQLRGQLRQLVKETWPELVKTEVYGEMSKLIKERLDLIHNMVRQELDKINERQKDVQSLVMSSLAESKLPTPNVEKLDEKS